MVNALSLPPVRQPRAVREALWDCYLLARRAYPVGNLVSVIPGTSTLVVEVDRVQVDSAGGHDLADAIAKLSGRLARRAAEVERAADLAAGRVTA